MAQQTRPSAAAAAHDPPHNRTASEALAGYVAGTLEVLAPCSSAILVSKDGARLMERYEAGPRPQSPAPVDEGSLWPFWSITKSFTAALVARLALRGALSLDMALSEALPEFGEHGPGAFDRRKLRLSHLMSHTSGCAIPGRAEDGVNLEPAPELSDIVVAAEPGSVFEYSSLGMHLLERFLEALTGADYGELLGAEILLPFGLASVRYLYEDDMRPGAMGRALPCFNGQIVPSQPRQRCGLGLYGTARDLLSFGERWLAMTDASGSPWCDAALRKEIWTRHSTRSSDSSDYGLLWWLFGDLEGCVASGASFGLCALLPRENIVAVVARNHYGPTRQPFIYRDDKRRILELASAFK